MSNNSIQAKFLRNMVLIALASIVLWSLLWMQGEYSDFKAESKRLRLEYIESQKVIIKREVLNRVNLIKLRKAQAEDRLKQAIKDRVYTAHQIASNIYQKNIGSKTPDEIGQIIKEALRPIRFDNGQGYYFAGSMNGIDVLYPVKPEVEGKNLIDLQDAKGNFVMQDEIEIINKSNEGFVTHYWPKPGNNPDKSFPKISFVKYFKPLNWYLGTGSYLDEAKHYIQHELLTRLAEHRFGIDGYFFGSTYKGDSLFSNGKVTLGQGNLWDLTDPDGVKIIQAQRKAVENKDGGFIYYSWHKLNTSPPSPKISFVIGLPDWEWMLGAGFYTDFINKAMAEKKAAMESHFKKQVIRSIFILTVLLALIWFWSKRILKQIQKSIDIFSSFLKKASTDSITIDPDQLELQEFREIAILTNEMLTNRLQAEKTKKELEEKLQQAQKMEAIGSLAGGIAHDFNNVLFSIIGFTELTIADMPKDDQNQSNLDQVLVAANRAKEMVQQILAFSRQTKTEKKPVKIQSIIKEVVKLLKSSIPSTIEIKVSIDKNCNPVFADPGQIHQIIMNLATNAAHAMKEKGGVMEFILKQQKILLEDLSIYPNLHTGTYIKLIVKDTGYGIHSEIIDKIFDPYFTTKKVGEGTGMGLSVVHGIISDHDGEIIVKTKPEKGTAFHIFLPTIEKTTSINQDLEQDITSPDPIPTGTENILFVDDDAQIAIMTEKILSRLGYHVTLHTDSRKALETFKKDPDKFDVIITDMTMPKMTGTELATKLFKIKPDVQIILCSGHSDLIDKQIARSMGIKEYITKPITLKQIAETIRRVLTKEDK
ncbi:MAG: cache domain-containing protein [Desulfobacteraceae bacterium]|nr:cache domain-containing protein [Desulfobacteraceae bacterium]